MGMFKKKSEPEDNSRKALFGNKAVAKAGTDNPYAQQGGNDPYTAPQTGAQASYKQYQGASYGGGLPGGPRAGAGGLPSGPRGAPPSRTASTASNETAPPPYTGGAQQPSGGYGADRAGAPSGYGSSRYDNAGYGGDQKQRGGGYGGLGPAGDSDQVRDNLFGGAKERYEQKQQQPGGEYGGSSGTSGAGEPSSYGGYGERRELTAEEQEEEEVQDVRRQIKQTKLASANSAENSERIASQAVETALGTYARLGAQHERLNYTEGLLDKASTSTREADGQTKKLKNLNRSMFAVHVANPFTSGKKTREMEEQILEQHRNDRDLREATRKAGWQANDHMEKGFKEIDA